jgi:hypothetical protein
MQEVWPLFLLTARCVSAIVNADPVSHVIIATQNHIDKSLPFRVVHVVRDACLFFMSAD